GHRVRSALRIRYRVRMSDDDDLILDTSEQRPDLLQQAAEVRRRHGTAALEHAALVCIVEHHAQPIRRDQRAYVPKEPCLLSEALQRFRELGHVGAAFIKRFRQTYAAARTGRIAVAACEAAFGNLIAVTRQRLARDQTAARPAGCIHEATAALVDQAARRLEQLLEPLLFARGEQPKHQAERQQREAEVRARDLPGGVSVVAVVLAHDLANDDLGALLAPCPVKHAEHASLLFVLAADP